MSGKSRTNFKLSFDKFHTDMSFTKAISEHLIKISPFSVSSSKGATLFLYVQDDVKNAVAKALETLNDTIHYGQFTLNLEVLSDEGNIVETISFNQCSVGDVKIGGFDFTTQAPNTSSEDLILSQYHKDFYNTNIINRIAIRYNTVKRKFAE